MHVNSVTDYYTESKNGHVADLVVGVRLPGFATNLTEYSAEIVESLRVPSRGSES